MGIEYDPRDHDPNYVADSAEAREFGLQLRDRLEAAFLEHPSAYWSEYLDAAGVPNGELTYTEELLEHEQVVANDYRVALTHEVLGEGEVQAPPAFQMQRTRLEPTKSSPPLGFHNREVLDELGVSDDEYAAWQESGLFG